MHSPDWHTLYEFLWGPQCLHPSLGTAGKVSLISEVVLVHSCGNFLGF